jgi:hypothetical protein
MRKKKQLFVLLLRTCRENDENVTLKNLTRAKLDFD